MPWMLDILLGAPKLWTTQLKMTLKVLKERPEFTIEHSKPTQIGEENTHFTNVSQRKGSFFVDQNFSIQFDYSILFNYIYECTYIYVCIYDEHIYINTYTYMFIKVNLNFLIYRGGSRIFSRGGGFSKNFQKF